VILAYTVLIQIKDVTDRQADGRPGHGYMTREAFCYRA